jgi:hypothetical protein
VLIKVINYKRISLNIDSISVEFSAFYSTTFSIFALLIVT